MGKAAPGSAVPFKKIKFLKIFEKFENFDFFEYFANKNLKGALRPNKHTHTNAYLGTARMSIKAGVEYEIVELKKRPDLNGTRVRVVSFIGDRVEVQPLMSSVCHNLSMKTQNLKHPFTDRQPEGKSLTQSEMECNLAAHYGLVQK